METPTKMGHIRRGWEIAKSSWRVFRLEPGLIAIELLSGLAAIVLLGLFFAGLMMTGSFVNTAEEFSLTYDNPASWAVIATFIILSNVIYTYFMGWFAHMVYERLDGKDPTVKGSMAAANARFGSLAKFGVVNGIVGFILQAIQEKASFLGSLVAFLGQLAWSVASIFAVPIIVTSNEPIGPFKAVKQSIELIKKTWGESVVSQFSIAIIGLIVLAGYSVVAAATALLLYVLGTSVALGVVMAILGAVVLLAIIMMVSLLSAIAQTALFYYAQTGKAPEVFNKELLQQAMTPKKARKIFG